MTAVDQEDWIVTLVHPEDYVYESNQVAAVTSERIIFVKGRTLALKAFERIEYPLRECRQIRYRTRYAAPAMVGGMLGLVLVAYLVWALIRYGAELDADAAIPIGAIGSVALFGWSRVSGFRRHEFIFEMASVSLRWRSKAGQFKSSMQVVTRLQDFARQRGLLRVPADATRKSG